MKKATAAVAIMKVLKGRKLGGTAKELTAKLNFAEKTIRNTLCTMMKTGVVGRTEKQKKCKVSSKAVNGYRSV